MGAPANLATPDPGLAKSDDDARDTRVAECIALCNRAAAGDLSHRLLHVADDEELSELCHAVNHLLDLVEATLRESTATLEATVEGRTWRRFSEVGLPGTFREVARQSNRALDAAAATQRQLDRMNSERAELASALREEMAERVASAEQGIASVGTATEAVSQSVANTLTCVRAGQQETRDAANDVAAVAAAAEQMSATIGEISEQSARTDQHAQSATSAAKAADEAMTRVREAASEVAGIVKVIQNIAQQTNLLALNASIEAARAGTAGKGFGVVATEVKALAHQAADASDDIEHRVESMQKAAECGSTHVATVFDALQESAEGMAAISAAIYQQNAATQQIARGAEGARIRTSSASNALDDILREAQSVDDHLGSVREAARSVHHQTRDLTASVGDFVKRVEGRR